MNEAVCFFLTPTRKVKRSLRRYSHGSGKHCPGPQGYHNARVRVENGDAEPRAVLEFEQADREDPRWPVKCEGCDYNFTAADEWQVFPERIYARTDTAAETTIRDAPPGAMWYADWMIEHLDVAKVGNLYRGPDGHCLMVRCPDGHDWMVDGKARNCTLPNDNTHKCWVRHGTVPRVTAGKIGGPTCDAGSGSIQTPNWHGFLVDGVLKIC